MRIRSEEPISQNDYRTICFIRNRYEAVVTLGGKCACCKCEKLVMLEIDHIVPVLNATRNSNKVYSDAKSGKAEDLQVLCANCHAIKTGYTDKYKTSRAKYYTKRRMEVLEILGNRCITCGCKDFRCLEIDHIIPINGVHPDNSELYRNIKNGDTKNLQILCACCHAEKHRYAAYERLLMRYPKSEGKILRLLHGSLAATGLSIFS